MDHGCAEALKFLILKILIRRRIFDFNISYGKESLAVFSQQAGHYSRYYEHCVMLKKTYRLYVKQWAELSGRKSEANPSFSKGQQVGDSTGFKTAAFCKLWSRLEYNRLCGVCALVNRSSFDL